MKLNKFKKILKVGLAIVFFPIVITALVIMLVITFIDTDWEKEWEVDCFKSFWRKTLW